MNGRDTAAIEAARSRRPLRSVPLDEGTNFVIRALDWILTERMAGRLTGGAPVTLVLFDFSPPLATKLGDKMDLENGEVAAGSIHLCAPILRPAHVLPGTGILGALGGHQNALAERQLASHTCVTFDPASGMVQVRLACNPIDDPIDMNLGIGLSPNWPSQDLAPLQAMLGAFHAVIDPDKGIGQLLLGGVAGARARIYYRNAIFLYLTYQMGLRPMNGFRVTARASDVKVTAINTGQTSLITAASTQSVQASSAAAMIDRLVAEAKKAFAAGEGTTHISCLACPSSDPPGLDCASPPVSLHHRHIKAA